MRKFKANINDAPAKNGVSNSLLLSQVRWWIFDYAGGNSAGPKRHCCHSLQEHTAKPSTEFWEQALGGICPHRWFWRVPGVLALLLCWLCSAPLGACCARLAAHLPSAAPSALSKLALQLPYTFKKAAATSKNFMIHCLLINLVTLTSARKEWQTSRYPI